MSHADPRKTPSNSGDIAYCTFYSGAIGGCTIALVFLAVDVMAGRPFHTPSALGSAAFFGLPADPTTPVNLTAVALFTMVHFVAFGLLGALGTLIFRATLARELAPTVVTGLALFAAMQGGMWVASRTFLPGASAVLGSTPTLMANVLTALAMTFFLKNALAPSPRVTEESEADLVEGPGLT